ncbi:MAG: hypothetical protein ACRD3W_05705, partial [Terriglobales bacterium]
PGTADSAELPPASKGTLIDGNDLEFAPPGGGSFETGEIKVQTAKPNSDNGTVGGTEPDDTIPLEESLAQLKEDPREEQAPQSASCATPEKSACATPSASGCPFHNPKVKIGLWVALALCVLGAVYAIAH